VITRILQSLGRGPAQAAAAGVIVPVIVGKLNPTLVIDVGCGDGAWLREFKLHGVMGVGYDRQPEKRESGWRTERCDLEDLKYISFCDVALCIEVAEHLSDDAGEQIIELLCNAAEAVVWGAAIPLIGGSGHINEQWPSYWAEEFERYGFMPHDDLRIALWEANVDGWYPQDLLIYCKPEVAKRYNLTPTRLLDIVHPKVWSRIGPMGIRQRIWSKL